MELTNVFRVPASVEQTWQVMTDVERVALCLPGAQLLEVDGDEFHGIVKVKVGPIRTQYKGSARFSELDAKTRTIRLVGEGRDSRGQGTAGATVTTTLVDDDGGTQVTVTTDLQVTGKVAQFGRNVMADVSDRLLGQFAENLEREVLGTREPASPPQNGSTDDGPGPPAGSAASTPRARAHAAQVDDGYIDLLDNAGPAIAKRAMPVLIGMVALLVGWRLGRHRSS